MDVGARHLPSQLAVAVTSSVDLFKKYSLLYERNKLKNIISVSKSFLNKMSLAKGNSRTNSYEAFISIHKRAYNFSVTFKETINTIAKYLFDGIYAQCVKIGRKTLNNNTITAACKAMDFDTTYDRFDFNINIHKYILEMKAPGTRISTDFETRMSMVISGLLHAAVQRACWLAKDMHTGPLNVAPVVTEAHLHTIISKGGRYGAPIILRQAVLAASINKKRRRMGKVAVTPRSPAKKKKPAKRRRARKSVA